MKQKDTLETNIGKKEQILKNNIRMRLSLFLLATPPQMVSIGVENWLKIG
jgi:hypothetical protein